MNSLGIDLTDKRVLLKKEIFKPEYQDEQFRKVKVLGGFGCDPNTRGTALIVRFECDGEEARFEGYEVERLLNDDE